jgi:ankyrin repeat protein
MENAVALGNLDAVAYVVEKDPKYAASVVDTARDNFDRTALMLCALNGRPDLARDLIGLGASLHLIDKVGRNALFYAASSAEDPDLERRRVETLGVLLDHGALIDASNSDGQTPLMVASWSSSVEAVRMLVDRGAALHARDVHSFDSLGYAALKDHVQVADIILDAGADIEYRGPKGRTPLMLGIKSGNHRVVELLLDRGANLASVDRDGWRAIHHAMACGPFEPRNPTPHTSLPKVLEILNRHGEDFNGRMPDGSSYDEALKDHPVAFSLLQVLRSRRLIDGVLAQVAGFDDGEPHGSSRRSPTR